MKSELFIHWKAKGESYIVGRRTGRSSPALSRRVWLWVVAGPAAWRPVEPGAGVASACSLPVGAGPSGSLPQGWRSFTAISSVQSVSEENTGLSPP